MLFFPIQLRDLNVKLILTAQPILHVFVKNVRTLAIQQPVELMLNVKLQITERFVFALSAMLETLTLFVKNVRK